jgi:VanZ family protein
VILWIGVILFASGDYFSATQSGSWLSALLGFFHVPEHHFVTAHLIVRKSAHLIEYGVLGLLAYRAFQCTWRDWRVHRWWLGGLAVSLLCALLDEFHQSTILSRTGSIADVLIDAAGASLGIFLFFWIGANERVAGKNESVTLDSQPDA